MNETLRAVGLVLILAGSIAAGGALAYYARSALGPPPHTPVADLAAAAPDARLDLAITALEHTEARLQTALDLLTARAMPPTPFAQFPILQQSPAKQASRHPGWRATVRKACAPAPLK